MRKAARRESAKAWLVSGAQVTVKSYAKRYGVDRYTAREDLEAVGFVFAPGDTRWSKRPEPVPRVAKADKDTGLEPDLAWVGDRLMLPCLEASLELEAELLSLRGTALYWLTQLGDAVGLAVEFGRAVLADCERVLGETHPDTLGSRHNLAAAYQTEGRSSGEQENNEESNNIRMPR
jgi:hypothetical protein